MLKASNTFFIILGTLNLGPNCGYDIKKRIEKSTGEFYRINYGQIYPMLKVMVEEGYAVLLPDDSSRMHDRKVYKITEKGEEEFLEWLKQPVNKSNSADNELLVRLFFGRFIPVEVNLKRLKEFRKTCIGYLAGMNRTKEEVETKQYGDSQYDYSMIAVRHGEMMIQMKIDWCDDCIERLSRQLNN